MEGNLNKQYKGSTGSLLSGLEDQVRVSQLRILDQTAKSTSQLETLNGELKRSAQETSKAMGEQSEAVLGADLQVSHFEVTFTLPTD